jgi:hypothetical protein
MSQHSSRLESFQRRLPSRETTSRIFTASVVVVQAWAFFNLFREVPAMRVRLETWDVIGVVAYVQAFALMESLLLTAAIISLGMLFARRLHPNEFSALGTVLILVGACWSIFIHYDLAPLASWPPSKIYGRLVLLIISSALALLLVWRFEPVKGTINKLTSEGFILAQLYALIGVLSIIVVIIRNIS